MASKVSSKIKPSQFLDYKLYFEALYQEQKIQYESYSYQAFAEDLGFSATSIMHQIIRAYRPLTAKSLKGALKHLDLDHSERQYLTHLLDFCNA